jgi:hypothetical protein
LLTFFASLLPGHAGGIVTSDKTGSPEMNLQKRKKELAAGRDHWMLTLQIQDRA